MTFVYFIVAAISLGYIGLLPHIFFRADGRRNLMWWATAAPFFVASAVLVGCFIGIWHPAYVQAIGGATTHEALAVPFAMASVALIAYTIGTHRVRLALWHQDDDAPQSIVTWGAYRHVRHPFYSAFLLALAGVAIGCPHPWTLGCLGYALLMLNHTARNEERKLADSAQGAQYRAYMARTGRFVPPMHGERAPVVPIDADGDDPVTLGAE
ncbi:MAG: isoprenylcysteine carboxylmethyltransferase family protein [Gammaproteobacteria bacterium]|nr:isoprenylcysteine carboxylmethyltransferase family protein [Gammaproteobacteria bacterium]